MGRRSETLSLRKLPPLYQAPALPKAWEVIVLTGTVLTLMLMALDIFAHRHSSWLPYLAKTDWGVSVLLLVDFGWRLQRASDRLRFLRDSWWELLGVVPLGALHLARIPRAYRIAVTLTRRPKAHVTVSQALQGTAANAMGGVAGVASAVWVVSALLFFAAEHRDNANVDGVDDAIWWSLTTLSTVGYGDIVPVTRLGRALAMTNMVFGVGVLSALAGTMASAVLESRDKGRKGLKEWRMKDHLLVLGWNGSARGAIEDFRNDERRRETPVCVVADLPEAPVEAEGVRFVRGRPFDPEALRKASAVHAAAAVVFARDARDPDSDLQTITVVHALRRVNTHVRISVELVDAANHEHVVAAGCDAVIDGTHLTSLLLARSVQDAGVVEIITDLVSAKEGAELYRVPLPERCLGMAVRDLAAELVEKRQTLMALVRGEAILTNPPPDEKILAGDDAFIVAQAPPRLS
jgi:voltage-gated potassium channel